MTYIITEFSKYIFIVAMGLYLIESIIPLFRKRGDSDRGVYIRQMVYIILIHALSMFTLYLVTEDGGFIRLYICQVICIFVVNRMAILIYDRASRMMINHMCLLLAVGFVVLSRLSYTAAFRQFIIVSVSLVLYMFIPYIIRRCTFIPNYGSVYGVIGIVLLVLVFSLGRSVNGSKLSYTMFGLSFQPSEFVKILFIFFVAGMLYENAKLPKVAITSAIAAVFVLLLALSKDLGSALIYYVVFIAMLLVSTGKLRYSVLGLGCGGVAAVMGYQLFDHVKTRIAVWQDPWSDIDRTGYQLTQSLFAIGTGGWMGMGLGKGEPSTIPYVDEDFMFSAICEEYGVIFGILLILVYLALFVLLLKITLRTKDNFYRIVVVGISTLICIQTFLTIGGGTRLIPLTGVTLPLISNGGSSAMSTIMLFGICLGVSNLPRRKHTIIHDKNGDEIELTAEEEERFFKRKKRNAYILTGCSILLFVALIVNICIYMNTEKDEAISNNYNVKRQEILAAETVRGSIVAADGTVLAETIVDQYGNERRYYPYSDRYAHIVGYSTYGTTGIENAMNMSLIQSNVSIGVRTSNGVNGIKNPGDTVVTTLIPELQDVAYNSLGIYRGAIVVSKADTGEILAMVSSPSFDPNTVSENWATLSEDTNRSVFLNRAAQGLYPPGSTFKIITTLEYMNEHPGTYMNYSYNCSGSIRVGETTIHCYGHNVHGYENLYASLGNSCNSSFANIGMSLSRTQFADTLNLLLFNQDLPVSFPFRQSHASMREYMDADEMVQTSIGQGEILMTPLHLNMVTLAIANDGVMMTPYVVSRVETVEGSTVKTFGPQEVGRVMTSEQAADLRELLTYDVEHGTARRLQSNLFSSAGKTGSAEYNESNDDSHAWFTGFAPADDPQVVVTIILESAGTGGDYCVPIAKRIFTQYFDMYGYPQ